MIKGPVGLAFTAGRIYFLTAIAGIHWYLMQWRDFVAGLTDRRGTAGVGNHKAVYNASMANGKVLQGFVCILAAMAWSTALFAAAANAPTSASATASARPLPKAAVGAVPAAHLILCGNGANLWLVVPSTIAGKPPQSGFALLLHTPGKKGAAAPWMRISAGLFLDTPLCAASAPIASSQAKASGKAGLARRFPASQPGRAGFFSLPGPNAAEHPHVDLLFNGTIQQYGIYRHRLLSALPKGIFPVAAVNDAGRLTVLGYGSIPLPALSVQFKTSTKAAVSATQTAARPVHAPAAKAASGHALVAAVKPLVGPPVEGWYLLTAAGGSYQISKIDGLGGPPSRQHPAAWPGMVEAAKTIWLMTPSPSGEQLFHVAVPADTTPPAAIISLKQPLLIPLPAGTVNVMPVALDKKLLFLWTTRLSPNLVRIHGAAVTQAVGKWTVGIWPRSSATMPVDLPNAADMPAAAGCAGRIYVVSRGAGGKLHELQLTQNGGTAVPASVMTPVSGRNFGPQNYERMIIMGLVLLMILSLWQRKTPLDARALSDNFVVARLYVRFGAALVDMGIAATILMVIYHLYSQAAWEPLAKQIHTVAFSPEKLFLNGQLLVLLGIYEVHITLGEIFFARSIGKFLFSLRVVSEDGKKPGFAAVMLRNLFRVPEMLVVVLLISLFVSVQRQRLGDLLARTVVVGPKEETSKGNRPNEPRD